MGLREKTTHEIDELALQSALRYLVFECAEISECTLFDYVQKSEQFI
jgi:hypothetical protein